MEFFKDDKGIDNDNILDKKRTVTVSTPLANQSHIVLQMVSSRCRNITRNNWLISLWCYSSNLFLSLNKESDALIECQHGRMTRRYPGAGYGWLTRF